MPHLVKNLSREQNKKKIKSCFEGTSKINIGLFCTKYMLYTNWLSIFYRHPNNYFYYNKQIGRRVEILYCKFIHSPIADLVERRTVEAHVILRSLVRVRVRGERVDILYISNNEMKLY